LRNFAQIALSTLDFHAAPKKSFARVTPRSAQKKLPDTTASGTAHGVFHPRAWFAFNSH